MKLTKALIIGTVLALALAGCSAGTSEPTHSENDVDAVEIVLGKSITVNGEPISNDPALDVYAANDIIYYQEGMGVSYGEGTEADAHSEAEAASHTVVHISEPGTYSVTGTLERGQLAVDLGEGAKDDPEAVVTLILNGTDITCEVAPAVIFYNVYECRNDDTQNASETVDTSTAGANVIIADETLNSISGSYVARIYQPDSVVLSEDGSTVEDAKKLHKYDGAFYSRMSMNISGGAAGTGTLDIKAENEGLDSELHLTINGGNINIRSGNDGINANEDGVSVVTVNGGYLNIEVTGETGEGDGIDSNGWLVINNGTVIASACSTSADAGIDSDMGISINGGTVVATGSMLDRIQDGGQTYAVFNFAQRQSGPCTVSLRNENDDAVVELTIPNDFSTMVLSCPELTPGTYTLWINGEQMASQIGGTSGFANVPGPQPGGMAPSAPPSGAAPAEPPSGVVPTEPPSGATPPQGPQGEPLQNDGWAAQGEGPADMQQPPAAEPPARPDGMTGSPEAQPNDEATLSTEFKISEGANMFSGVTRQS